MQMMFIQYMIEYIMEKTGFKHLLTHLDTSGNKTVLSLQSSYYVLKIVYFD